MPFLSKSGRVKIISDDYFRYLQSLLPEGYTESWDAIPLFVDSYTPPKVADTALDNATTLAQGLSNGPHTLELILPPNATNPIRRRREKRCPPVEAAAGGGGLAAKNRAFRPRLLRREPPHRKRKDFFSLLVSP